MHSSQESEGVDYNKAVDDLLYITLQKGPYECAKKSSFRVDNNKKEVLETVEGKEEEQSELSFEGSVSIPELVHTDSLVNIKDSQVSLMKINSLFSYVEPEELLRNNSGVSWQLNDARLQLTTQEKLLQEV